MGKNYFKNRLKFFISLTGFIFGLFIFFVPSSVKADFCHQTCGCMPYDVGGCITPSTGCAHAPGIGAEVDRVGIIGTVLAGGGSEYYATSTCISSVGKCQNNYFLTGTNGQSCIASDSYWNGLGCSLWRSSGGKWDISESKCILCSGIKESNVLGYTASKYCSDGSNHVCAYSGYTNGDTGNGYCESACGADSSIDEFPPMSCSTTQCGYGDTKRVDCVDTNCNPSDGACESTCGAAAACDGKNPGDSCSTGICNASCQCVAENCCVDGDEEGDGLENGRDTVDCAKNVSLVLGSNTICWWTEWNDYSNSTDYYSGWYTCPTGSVVSLVNIYQYTASSDYFYMYDSTSTARYQDYGTDGTKDVDLSSYNTQQVRFRFISNSSTVNDGVKVNTITCAAPPDLQITAVSFDSSKRVNYTIYNAGGLTAALSRSYLYIDNSSSYNEYDSVSALNALTSSNEYFSGWQECTTGQSYIVEVCADRAGPNGAVAGIDQTVIESIENNNCYPKQTLTCPACSGAVSLALSPNPANPSVLITATVSGLLYCEDAPAVIKQGSCSGTTQCTCYISSGSCSCDFNGPASTTTYYACVHKNADTDYSDTGEQDSEILTVQAGATGTLGCSSSTTSSITLSYSFLNGTNVSLFNGTTLLTTFGGSSGSGNYTDSGLSAGTSYTYYLRNGTTTSSTLLASATCTTQSAGNNPPTCNAGSDKTINENTSTTLDGSASDPDGDTLTYNWACTGGSLNNSTIPQPTYTAPSVSANTDYTCTLNVSDGKGGTCSDQMIVHVQDVPAGATIVPPIVATISATPNQTSATLNGILNTLGYNPATCTNCQCIVWFEWGTTGTSGVSGSYGNSTTPVSITADNYPFTAIISGLTPGQTYKFEAFAKNGGSW